MSNQRLGRATIKYDGKILESDAGAKIELGGDISTPLDGHPGKFTKKPVASKLECTIPLSPDTPIEEIRSIDNATVSFDCDTGQSYIIRNAFVQETLSITDGEGGGKIPVVFGGPAAEKA